MTKSLMVIAGVMVISTFAVALWVMLSMARNMDSMAQDMGLMAQRMEILAASVPAMGVTMTEMAVDIHAMQGNMQKMNPLQGGAPLQMFNPMKP
ncbi:hypothetical protein [Magnetospira thiophila]